MTGMTRVPGTGGMSGPDLLQMVAELCEPTRQRAAYTVRKRGHMLTRYHVVASPPLIAQLYGAVLPSGSAEAGLPRPSVSRPAGRIEAIDAAVRIDLSASAWVRWLGEDDPGDTIACVRRVGALSASVHRCGQRRPRRGCCTHCELELDVRAWWTWARVITGWDAPPWRPANTCPVCGVRGSLRVRVTDKLAVCADGECLATWDDTTIGLLADHIRSENGDPTGDTRAS